MTHLAAQKICMFVVGKEASTCSTELRNLHGIADFVKNGARIKFENLVHSILKTKTQLCKLM